jgi:hypothetical protein
MKIVKSESIHLLARNHGYFPAAFRWRGRRFDVTVVDKCWTVHGPATHRMFQVRCAAGSFVLEHCVASDTWRVSRWPLALFLPWPRPQKPARFPCPDASAGQPAGLWPARRWPRPRRFKCGRPRLMSKGGRHGRRQRHSRELGLAMVR